MIKLAASTLVFLLTLVLTTASSSSGQSLLADKVIVIDPGHGGIYPGAVHNGIREATVNLAVALKVRDRLAATGAAVILTRTTDTNLAAPGASLADDLQARVDVAKTAGADIFISLHANADENVTAAGVIGFFPAGRPDDLARALKDGAVHGTAAVDGGVRPANFYVLRNSEIPAALLEMGFLTCPEEAACLSEDTYQNQLAEGIVKGIITYFQDH
ncbi:MAG: N-acetylmuramoyl-L-alanine amidase [Negativicutes bacterium]|nr:N-acetylmuramoyl-L-alanine amidase [Negativicutes bacterium]